MSPVAKEMLVLRLGDGIRLGGILIMTLTNPGQTAVLSIIHFRYQCVTLSQIFTSEIKRFDKYWLGEWMLLGMSRCKHFD